ncbi:MAG: hypothetical protein WBD09_02230 [Halobacteriota archaeon]
MILNHGLSIIVNMDELHRITRCMRFAPLTQIALRATSHTPGTLYAISLTGGIKDV